MTDGTKHRALAWEILGLIGVSAFFAGILFVILTWTAAAVAENYCFYNDVAMTEFDWLEVDRWIFGTGAVISACGFSVLFLTLLSDRMAYIRTITAGIEALRLDRMARPLPLEGRNELTRLAEAINCLSETQLRLRQKEQALAREKEQFIRTLSHDIRTPLTAIMAYAEYLAGENSLSGEQRQAYVQMIGRKAAQIRDLTALLLDGDRRTPERFDDARLLMEQLAAEFEEILEDRFDVRTDLSGCPAFSGVFDVQQLRRIFDNLSSNVEKYADPGQPVRLAIRVDGEGLRIIQSNAIAPARPAESCRLGISSIRRIAHGYGGRVEVQRDGGCFRISVTLCDYL